MATLLPQNFQVSKMAFTNLITALLGANPNANVSQNLTNFFNTTSPSLSSITNFQSFTSAFNSASNLLGQVTNPVVQLYLNPNAISVKKRVLLDKKQTRGGFVVQFWGHDLEEVTVEAASAYFEISQQPLQSFQLLKSQVYQARFNDTQPYQGTPIISMLYESQVLNGYFNNFDFQIKSKDPYWVTYSFQFTVIQNLTSVFSSSLATTASNLINVLKTGNLSANNNASPSSVAGVTFAQGWGVQLY